ncbi:S-layer protein domain-containing protein [Methanohalophilus sp.]|uniref:S-layer protein domain-containing protein n=1 Tax=Methanohalophilus sp. TaxID=1966352 RepID=UPI002625BFD0|nr:S-layer protein domain-containing protein [Methanohalophilus sp.]MDK2891979.1 hypothetical protein [Methanohalophilus sp.]
MKTKTIALLCFFVISLYSFSFTTFAEEFVLENGTSLNIRTGHTKQLQQNYSLTVKYVNLENNRVWISLQRDGVSVKEDILGENETLDYVRDNNTILSITLKQIYYGSEGELVSFEPIFQYIDPELPPDPDYDNDTVISNDMQNNSTNSENPGVIPGFGITSTILCLTGIYLKWCRIKA